MPSLFENLHDYLNQYQSPTSQQQQFQKQIQSYSRNKNILSSQYFSPGHITVSALILSPDRMKIALIFHPFLKMWLQPGGHLEQNDKTLLNAAKREAVEETSISSLHSLLPQVFDLDIHTIPVNSQKEQPAHLHLDFRFLLQTSSWDIKASSEIKAAKWFSLSEVLRINTDDSVRRLVAKIQ